MLILNGLCKYTEVGSGLFVRLTALLMILGRAIQHNPLLLPAAAGLFHGNPHSGKPDSACHKKSPIASRKGIWLRSVADPNHLS